MRRVARVVVLLLASSLLLASAPPITDAEKAACEIVADHLARGPVAFSERLSPQSPLATLRPDEALAELEARVGPAAGASWVLRTTSDAFAEHGAVFHVVFPSGVEDVIAVDLVPDRLTWKVRSVSTMVDVPPSALKLASSTSETAKLPVTALFIAASLLAIVGAVFRQSWPRASSAVLTGALICAVLPIAETIDPGWASKLRRRGRNAPEQEVKIVKLGGLASFRRAAAAGDPLPPIGGLAGFDREVASVWKLQAAGASATPEEVRKQLGSVKILDRAALTTLLRARSAASDGKNTVAGPLYVEAGKLPQPHDAFELEWQIVREASPGGRSMHLADDRSRDGWVYYGRAAESMISGQLDAGRDEFREAWAIQPVSRETLVAAGVFALILRDPAFSTLVSLNEPEEEKRADASLGRSPMRVPNGARASASGLFLRLVIGDGRLDVPGGAAIAPSEAAAASPSDLEREEAEAMVARLKASTTGYTSLSNQRLLVQSIRYLEENNRWDDISTLTQELTPQSENVTPSLILWRARALLRARRSEEARRILVGSAMTRAMQRAPDAGTMIEAAAILEKAEAWNDAASTLRQASAVKGGPAVGLLLRRLELRKQLASSPPVIATNHFAVHTTPDVPSTVAERIGQLLEAELARVSAKLGTTAFSPVRVNVLHWDDFANDVTFTDHILGFYDGDITIPFGNVSRFRESVVAILTHEMTHAVVAQATGDNAPRWFQEGLAQRMELVERQENIFQVKNGEAFRAMRLVDETLSSSIDPLAIGEGYVASQTFIRFLEDRYGSDSPVRLMASFKEGNSTDEALVAVTGKRMTDLDREFRVWGATHTAAFVDSSPWPYASLYSLGIDPAVREGIRFSRPKP